MKEPGDLPRLYGEKEVSKLLKRATDLQREEPARAASVGGLSLQELEEIALEAGIDPRHLRQAAMELDTGVMEPSRLVRFLGDTPRLAAATTVPGELNERDFEELIPAIQEVTREHGQPSLLGRTLTWHAEIGGRRGRTRSMQVTVTSRNGETHIQAEEHLHNLARGIFGGGMGGVGVGVGVGVGTNLGIGLLHSALFATAFPLGFIGLAYLGAREIFRKVASNRRRLLAEVVERLSREVAAVEHATFDQQLESGAPSSERLPPA